MQNAKRLIKIYKGNERTCYGFLIVINFCNRFEERI